MVMWSAWSALRHLALRSRRIRDSESSSAELNGKCTRTDKHSASPAEMSTHRLRMHSWRSPQSKSRVHDDGSGGDAVGAALAVGAVFAVVVAESFFASGLCAHPKARTRETIGSERRMDSSMMTYALLQLAFQLAGSVSEDLREPGVNELSGDAYAWVFS
jgi:hypothetical protein